MLSGYRFMWLQVIFDLPVKTKSERKQATQFRTALLNLGFKMVQFSVYMKFVTSKKKAETLLSKIKIMLPLKGSVYVIQITDKQYENIYGFIGKKEKNDLNKPEQLELF